MLQFANKVAVITGAGNGLGKSYALYLASRGVKIVVNNRVSTISSSPYSADQVVHEIRQNGGIAVPNYDDCAGNGEDIVRTAMDNFGTVDILINNAGINIDKTMKNMTDVEWKEVIRVNLDGMFSVTKAVWNIMCQKKYGRIINIGSAGGLYGNIGQANYATSKVGVHGFTRTLALEGAKYNINVNTVCPLALSKKTPSYVIDTYENMSTEYIAPFIALLASDDFKESGSIFEVGGGHIMKLRWQRTKGVVFDRESITPEEIFKNWDQITDWTQSTYPECLFKDSANVMFKKKKIE